MSRVAILVLLASCGGDNIHIAADPDAAIADPDAAPDAAIDAAIDAAPDDGIPQRLEDTGLYFRFPDIIHPQNVEYEPQFELWADGATKRRWVRLPPGSQIDTSNMDFWSYPVDTRIFKEFSRGGLRVETRMIWKRGPNLDDWVAVTYAWNAAQDEAVRTDGDAVPDALGTGHDIPGEFACLGCHGKQPDFVLGFSAIQLDTDTASFGLDELIADDRLTDPPAGGPVFFPLPGSATDQAALGYLHGNCGGCHHPTGVARDIHLRLAVADMANVTDTDAFTTTVGVAPEIDIGAGTALIEAGDPDNSIVVIRMEALDNTRMPEIGSEEVDVTGVTAVRNWILGL